MPLPEKMPDIKQLLGSMIFASSEPVNMRMIRKTLREVTEAYGEAAEPFAEMSTKDLRAVLDELMDDLNRTSFGFKLIEGAQGYRFQSDAECGPWLRFLLNIGKPSRMSRPALETLAIVAYRQPVTRAEVEAVRGVAVDHVIRSLMEMQLIRITGRSELPGRPMLLGTTELFLEHFGIKSLEDLPNASELKRIPLHAQTEMAMSGDQEPATDDEIEEEEEFEEDESEDEVVEESEAEAVAEAAGDEKDA